MGKLTAELDSKEELYFQWFLDELKEKGYVREYTLQPNAFILSKEKTYKWNKPKPTKKEPNRIEEKESVMIEASEYTADAQIIWMPKAEGVFYVVDKPTKYKCSLFIAHFKNNGIAGHYESYVEIKPIFDMQNMTRVFITKQKWIYQLYNIYINLVTPIKLFEKMFTPHRYLFTDGGRQTRKLKHKVKTLEEYIKNYEK